MASKWECSFRNYYNVLLGEKYGPSKGYVYAISLAQESDGIYPTLLMFYKIWG